MRPRSRVPNRNPTDSEQGLGNPPPPTLARRRESRPRRGQNGAVFRMIEARARGLDLGGCEHRNARSPIGVSMKKGVSGFVSADVSTKSAERRAFRGSA